MSLFRIIKNAFSSSGDANAVVKMERKHGEIGEYLSYPDKDYWSKEIVRASGDRFTISGSGLAPSKEQIKILKQLENDFESLIKIALEAVHEPVHPPRAPRILISYDSKDLKLRDIFIENSESYSFYFDTEYGDAIDNWPIVEFVNGSVKESYWSS